MLVYFEMGVPTFWPEKETLDEADAMLKWIYHTQVHYHFNLWRIIAFLNMNL